ncbi:pullulanase [bacterium]|nr:pullulanase [bacterium]
MNIEYARLVSLSTIHVQLSQPVPELGAHDIIIAPSVTVEHVDVDGGLVTITVDGIRLSRSYSVLVRKGGNAALDLTPCIDAMRPEVPLGCSVEEDVYVFRLFAPRAESVRLHLFESFNEEMGDVYHAEAQDSGIWRCVVKRSVDARWYAYSIEGSREKGEMFNSRILVGDPYAHAAVSRNTFRHATRCLLPDRIPSYDWKDDAHVTVAMEDLVVYEMHVRDMTAHPHGLPTQELPGTYAAVAEGGTLGVIDYLKSLGVNAVELLPLQQYAWMEPPYKEHAGDGVYNDWNPYERNHWGYMTSYFFAPEARYSRTARLEPGQWNAAAPEHVSEFKDMVRAFHRAGIAVIMDVVYNHTSQYDYQPLKYIDQRYYYRSTESGALLNDSGCGNDLDSRKFMTRRLIVESVLHWVDEYHIDGFRFDLASIIDADTFREIRDRVHERHPGIMLIAEPWGGEYNPAGFSDLDIAAWNDVFRNGVKGYDPIKGKGYLFGGWGQSSPEDFGKWVLGSVRSKGGPFRKHAHSINYLESHDGYTLGDFIRIATGMVSAGKVLEDTTAHLPLRGTELRIARLAAVMLFASRGGIMLHAGQEFARSKVIADSGVRDSTPGLLDHNSYEKDDATNWLDFRVLELNRPLFEYYRGLIALRAATRLLRHAAEDRYMFLAPETSLASGFCIAGDGGEPELAVLVNANHHDAARYQLPGKMRWKILVNAEQAGTSVLGMHEGTDLDVPPLTACIMQALTS